MAHRLSEHRLRPQFIFGWGMLAYSHVLAKQEENILLSMSMQGLSMAGMGRLRQPRRQHSTDVG